MSHESESVVLTLVMPVDVEDALLETLLDHPDLASPVLNETKGNK